MSSNDLGFSPGDRAVVRASSVSPDIEPGAVVWVKRVAGDEVEVVTEEAAPRTLTISAASLAAFAVLEESSMTRDTRRNQRPSFLVQLLRPVAFFLVAYFVWQYWKGWPRYEEPKALPSPPVQRPAMPRERYVPPPALPAEGR